METQLLEKQFGMWKHFLFLMIGSSITLVSVSLGNIVYSSDWSGFGNYVGGIWSLIQFLATFPGFYLLWGRRWKPMHLSERINTIFGYFAVSWLNLFSLVLIVSMAPTIEFYLLIAGIAILIVFGYIWAVKKMPMSRDEMFP